MARLWIVLGALAGLLAVAFSTVAAHALPTRLDPARLRMVESAIQIQGWHALALVLTGVWVERSGAARLANLAGLAFALGLVLFCGAVYGLALGGVRLGPTAPTGGILLMLGWLLLGTAALFG